MNISPVNSALSALQHAPAPGTVRNELGIQMLDKALENSEAANAGMVKMMEMSVNPNVGGNFDMSV